MGAIRLDDELSAMKKVIRELVTLDHEARQRVLAYVTARLAVEPDEPCECPPVQPGVGQ